MNPPVKYDAAKSSGVKCFATNANGSQRQYHNTSIPTNCSKIDKDSNFNA